MRAAGYELVNADVVLIGEEPRLAPQRGTSLGSGILASLNTLLQGSRQNPSLYSNLTPTPPLTPTPMPMCWLRTIPSAR